MKFRLDRDVLADAVTWTARSLPQRPPAPVLSGVLIKSDDDSSISLSTFDYEVSARATVAAEVGEAGTILVSGKLLAEISRALPNKPVEITTEGTKASVVCGSSRFTLLTMPVEEYPALPEFPTVIGSIDSEEFTHAVAQVSIAASKDDTLPLLTTVRVEVDGDKITLLATDRYRLALREITWQPSTPGFEAAALVRARTLSDSAKSFSSAGKVEIALQTGAGMNRIGFVSGGRVTTSQLEDGEYPHVRRLFPDSTSIQAVVDTAALIDATKRVALVAERNNPIRLSFTQGQVVLDAGQGDDAQASEILEAELTGDDISVAFNPHYLLDGLAALGTPFVRMGFTHPNKPVEFVGLRGEDGESVDNYRYLLVPIRFTA